MRLVIANKDTKWAKAGTFGILSFKHKVFAVPNAVPVYWMCEDGKGYYYATASNSNDFDLVVPNPYTIQENLTAWVDCEIAAFMAALEANLQNENIGHWGP